MLGRCSTQTMRLHLEGEAARTRTTMRLPATALLLEHHPAGRCPRTLRHSWQEQKVQQIPQLRQHWNNRSTSNVVVNASQQLCQYWLRPKPRPVWERASNSSDGQLHNCRNVHQMWVQNDYLMMEPAARKPHPPPGYLPMSPAVKQRLGKVISNSNPNLIAPVVDRSGKPSGSSMLHANVYQRKQLMDSADNLDKHRRRSNSADSTRCEEVENPSPCHCGQTVVRRYVLQLNLQITCH